MLNESECYVTICVHICCVCFIQVFTVENNYLFIIQVIETERLICLVLEYAARGEMFGQYITKSAIPNAGVQ